MNNYPTRHKCCKCGCGAGRLLQWEWADETPSGLFCPACYDEIVDGWGDFSLDTIVKNEEDKDMEDDQYEML